MTTQITELLDIKYPIIQGGMAWIADASLAAAVSNGGGLGLISAMNANADWLRKEIKKAKALTNKPFGVNIMLMSPFADEVAKVVIEEGVKVVTTGAGNPSKYIKDWLNSGIKVLPVVASVALAKLAQKYGASAVIAEGGEAGGHVGDLTTMTLVPQVADAVNIPVIAAGGIADGRGIAASFMLGASGVQIGTRFLVADECNIHQNYKDRIIGARDIDTIVTGKRLGHPVRCLKTPFSRELFACEYNFDVSNQQLEAMGAGALRLAVVEGDLQKGCFMCGQSAALVKRQQAAKDIILDLIIDAEKVLSGKCIKWEK